jgi:hypothetical protein
VVLVDTTVWIDFLRGDGSSAVSALRQLLEEGEACLAPVVLQELLQGAASQRPAATLRGRSSNTRCRYCTTTAASIESPRSNGLCASCACERRGESAPRSEPAAAAERACRRHRRLAYIAN